MPVKINGQTYYRTAEVCRIVGISRSTFFRWLKEGVLGKTEYRDRRGWRLFTEDDVAKLKSEASKMTVNSSQALSKPKGMAPHILVVDDDPLIGRLFKSSLERHGYQVTTALSGKDGLKLATKKRFDLIFLDLVMPELDGAELFRRIREMNHGARVAIITGYPDSDLMAKAIEQGPFIVMKKPFDIVDILETVRRFAVSSRQSAVKSRRSRRKATGNILIVEDEPSMRAVLSRTLSASGYQTQAVSDGKAALRKLAETNYDLIIADLKMPGMDGRELYEAMQKKHPNLAERVVFITGDVLTAETHDFLASTGRAYLAKPFDSKGIIGTIEKALMER